MKKLLVCTDYEPLAKVISRSIEVPDCEVVRLIGNSEHLERNIGKFVKDNQPTHMIMSYRNFDVQRIDVVAEATKSRDDMKTAVICGHPDRIEKAKEKGYDVHTFLNRGGINEFLKVA